MRRILVVAAILAIAAALWCEPPPPDSGPRLRDFEAYYAAGATWHYRGDPYGRDVWRTEKDVPGVVPTRDELLPFVGPPFGLPLWSALARLPFAQASAVWTFVLAAAAATLVLASVALGRGRLALESTFAAGLLAAGFAPVTSGFVLGQVALVACAAIATVPFALRPRRTLGAVAAILTAALQPNLAIVLAARFGDARANVALLSAGLFALGASALALGDAGGLARYASVVRDHGAAERFIAIQTAPAAVARAFGASPALAQTCAALLAFATLAILGRQFASRRFDPDGRLVLAGAAAPLLLPFAHEHDYAIAFVPATVALMRARGRAWILAALAALALSVDWLGLVQRPAALASTCALAFAAACASAALASDRLRPYHAAPFALVPAVAVAGWLAASHPLPTWPSALPSDFHVPATWGAALVWHEEQLRSGIAVLDPVWGALRAVPLAACAAVWFAASRACALPSGSGGSRGTR